MKIYSQKKVLRYLTQGLHQKRLSPSLLFVGPDSIGKRTVAMELCKTMACNTPLETGSDENFKACTTCVSCQKIEHNSHPDFLLISKELQAQLVKGKPEAQNTVKIESIRHINKFLNFKPLEIQNRLVVIDQAHTLTIEAANALLKTLEEPPPTAQLILLCTDERLLPSTIRSRCALVRFQPIPAVTLSKWLQSEFELPFDQADVISNQANGSFSRAKEYIDKKNLNYSITSIPFDEFLKTLTESSFRRDGRNMTKKILLEMTTEAQTKLEKGDTAQVDQIQFLLQARKQIDHYVPPRLVLENLYLKLNEN